ncbi:unnamed protein product [Umbelopsis ramanniana]
MSSEVRSWRGIDGKFAVQATFGGLFQNTKVKLIKSHGGIVAIPLDRLCPEDQSYVRQTAKISTTASLKLNLKKSNDRKFNRNRHPNLNLSQKKIVTAISDNLIKIPYWHTHALTINLRQDWRRFCEKPQHQKALLAYNKNPYRRRLYHFHRLPTSTS